jgi:alkylated DNA nucleotide flippase Atl1
MNQEIAQNTVWGRDEIHARADQLAERIIARWPGPNPTAQDVTAAAVWSNLDPVLAEIPAGAWTSYGDVAALLGTHPVPLGQRLANHPTVNAHRVLNASGQVAGNFRWTDENRTDDPRDVLELEGIHFDENGRASASQRLTAEDLAVLTGLETDSDALPGQAGSDSVERHHRFLEQVGEHQPESVGIALGEVLDAWVHLGGSLGFGLSDETSCFLLTSPTVRSPWPFTIYPTGKVEVVFQHMASRPPFDDVQVRHDFRERLDAISGVDLPPSKIELRPGFQLEVLADPAARDAVIEHLAWFIDVCRRHEAEGSPLT